MSGRTRRLYFALWPDAEVRAAIVARTAEALAEAGGRAVPPADLHVTLAFLGAVPAERYGDAVAAARGVIGARSVQAFDRVATWGRGGPLVLEATQVAEPLAALQRSLQTALEAADFRLDRRPFRPHITLSRRPGRRLGAVRIAPVEWPYGGFVLVESETRPEGSRYRVTETFGST
jgi:2'-5' RNA ligase